MQGITIRSARGPGQTFSNVAPLLKSADGSKRTDPKKKRSGRVIILLTPGDLRVDPPLLNASCRSLIP